MEHHSNDCHGWPYSTTFDQPNFSEHFRLFGQKVNKANKQNCRICGSENPNLIIEKPMHPRVTVWCGFWYGGIIGAFFFENVSMASVTVPCSTNFCFLKLRRMTWTTFGFNKMVGPLASQPRSRDD